MKFHFLKKEEHLALVMFMVAKGTVNYPGTESKLACRVIAGFLRKCINRSRFSQVPRISI